MLRSSTSSSDRRAGGWSRVALGVLAALVALEGVLRIPAVRHALPARTHYYHPSIAERLDDIARVSAQFGRIDVLFTGSSIVRTDVNPPVFDAAVGSPVVSFNAALDGIWPGGVDLYTRHLWLEVGRPRIVIQGIRYPELLVEAMAKHDTQIWSGTVETAWRDAGLVDRFVSAATLQVRLLQYRGVLTSELRRWASGFPGGRPSSMGVRGYEPQPAARHPLEHVTADLPNDGTCDPARCDTAWAALRRTSDAIRLAGAEYVLVNVPEHGSRWRGPGGVARYRQYVDAVCRFAKREGIIFVDPTDGDPFRFDGVDAFGDLSHMTADASVRFTREIASRVRPALVAALRREARAVATTPASHAR